jgi:hypothetical protein
MVSDWLVYLGLVLLATIGIIVTYVTGKVWEKNG